MSCNKARCQTKPVDQSYADRSIKQSPLINHMQIDQIVSGIHNQNHPVDVGALLAAKITSSVKRKAVDDIFKPASAIVEEVIIN